MPIREKCLVCGLDLLWINSDRLSAGGYVHLFTEEGAPRYKAFHTPVPSLENPSVTDAVAPERSLVAFEGARGSMASDEVLRERRIKGREDVRIFVQVLKAIFEAR